MTRDEMIRTHDSMEKADAYILGFEQDGKVYMKLMKTLRDDVLKLDHASSKRGGVAKIRVRVSAKVKAILKAQGAQVIGEAYELAMDSKYNRGENFERMVTEKLTGRKWEKDNIAWNVQGDIEWNGMQIQVKFDGAELTNEKTLARAMA